MVRLNSVKRLSNRALAGSILALGLMAVPAGQALAHSNADKPKDNACLPGPQTTLGPLAFLAESEGSGAGDAALDPGGGATEQTSQGRLTWDLSQKVTGNAGPAGTASPGTMYGQLQFTLSLGSNQKITFKSQCILEAGVFNDTEDDPFAPEAIHPVKRGVEGEWQGTAKNFPTPGTSSTVVAAIAVWTVNDGKAPRFKIDIATGTKGTPGTCLSESTPGAALNSTAKGGNVELGAPNQNSGRGICVQNAQQEQQ
jgi:hypothetical protein